MEYRRDNKNFVILIKNLLDSIGLNILLDPLFLFLVLDLRIEILVQVLWSWTQGLTMRSYLLRVQVYPVAGHVDSYAQLEPEGVGGIE